MDFRIFALAILFALVIGAGCTGTPTTTGNETPAASITTPVPTATPDDTLRCATDADCVPAQCCHPTSCMNSRFKSVCTLMCTQVCQGPLDCGAGSCGCIEGMCRVVPSSAATVTTANAPSIKLSASPQRYSPIMSSTPGIGLSLNTSGFNASDATFEWNATYGAFLTWDAPDYSVHMIGNPATTGNGTVYWTFTDSPSSTQDPVIITVLARETAHPDSILGASTATLKWDGNFTVYVDTIT